MALQSDDMVTLVRSMDLPALKGAPTLQRIVALARQSLGVPVALLTMSDASVQHVLAVSDDDASLRQCALNLATMSRSSTGLLEIEDLAQELSQPDGTPDPAEQSQARFYAEMPVELSGNSELAALRIVDIVPRCLSAAECATFQALAQLASSKIQLLRKVGRRDATTGLPNLQQMSADLVEHGARKVRQLDQIVVVEVFSTDAAGRLSQALGLPPAESLERQLGARVTEALPAHIRLYHISSMRFAFVVEDADSSMLQHLLISLQSVVVKPVSVSGILVSPTFRAGVAPFDGDALEVVLRMAVTALQEAGEKRTAWVEYDRTRDLALRRQYILALQVSDSLRDNAFRLVYQPRLDFASGRIVSAEALLRWHHPQLGPIAPNEFLPLIEHTSLMPRVTDWVIGEALRQLKRWCAAGLEIGVSINLTAADLEDGHIAERAGAWALESGVDPTRIEFEITERQAIRGEHVIEQLHALRRLGFSVALDDFGSGYCNFAYLSSLPADVIKIDRSLIDGVAFDSRRAGLVKGLVLLASQLNFRTVGEGVESQAQLDLLKLYGCHEAQGFFISEPLDPRALHAYLLSADAGANVGSEGRMPKPARPLPQPA